MGFLTCSVKYQQQQIQIVLNEYFIRLLIQLSKVGEVVKEIFTTRELNKHNSHIVHNRKTHKFHLLWYSESQNFSP